MRVVVTGGSSGLGEAIARAYASAGATVLVTDVNEPTALPAGQVSYQRLDVRSETDWARVRDWCEREWGGLDVLVNNAGVASAGRIDRTGLDDWDWILDINFKGVLHGCRTFVPQFKRQGSGHLVNIASLAGLMNLPGMGSYNVSKSAVIALSETLRYELGPHGVHTTVVCPGFVPTGLGTGLRSSDPVLADLAQKLIKGGRLTPDQIATQVVNAVRRKRFLVNTHPEGRVAITLKRLLPGLVHAVVRRQWLRTTAKLNAHDTQESAT